MIHCNSTELQLIHNWIKDFMDFDDLKDIGIPLLGITLILTVLAVTLMSMYDRHIAFETQLLAIQHRCEIVEHKNQTIVWGNCKGPIIEEVK